MTKHTLIVEWQPQYHRLHHANIDWADDGTQVCALRSSALLGNVRRDPPRFILGEQLGR